MAWVNAFKQGACTVIVRDFAYASLFESPMQPGDTGLFVDPTFGVQIMVTVRQDGSVSLDGPSGFLVAQRYSVIVQPNYQVTGDPMQNSGLSVGPGAQVGSCFAQDVSNANAVAFSTLYPVTPDPIVLTDIPGPHGIFGMKGGAVGIPLVLSGTLPDGAIGTPYSAGLTASGGQPPYVNWRITVGSLPPGLSINGSTGIISGTPT